MEYMFLLPRKMIPRDRTGVRTDFICRETVSLSEVGMKDGSCLTERSSCLPSEAREDSEARLDSHPEWRPRKGKLSQGKGKGPIVRFLSQGYHFHSSRIHFPSLERFVKP